MTSSTPDIEQHALDDLRSAIGALGVAHGIDRAAIRWAADQPQSGDSEREMVALLERGAQVSRYVHEIVDNAPPLSPEQRDLLAAVFRGI